jgi:ribonuclease HI
VGFGVASNNQAEAMAVYMGLNLIKEEHYKDLIIIGDSELVINGLQHPEKCHQLSLQRNYQRIIQEGVKFHSLQFFHVLRHLNSRADTLAKSARSLEQGQLKVNDVLTVHLLP